MIIDDILGEIMKSDRIDITFHKSPDGDSLGSALALFQGLRNMGKKIEILSMEEIPEDFRFLPYSNYIDKNKYQVEQDVQCVIVLDCGDKKRINAKLDFEKRTYTIINIDHHLTNENYGDFNYIDTKAAAVSEIVYEILKKLNLNIDENMAKCMYTSLITDSGSFKYPSTTSRTHKIAAELINTGFDFSSIHRIIFDNEKFGKIKLLGRAIDNMKLVDGKLCVIKVTRAMMEEFLDDDDVDTHDIVNMGLKIDSVDTSLMLKETEDGIKASLRSKEIVDVRKIAENFNGGGHTRAAGLQIADKTIDEVENLLVEEIKKELL